MTAKAIPANRSQPNLTVLVGYACNNRCLFCTVEGMNRGDNKTTAEIKAVLRRYPLRRRVSFSGGEPTMRRDIFELAAYAKKLGYADICVETNGRMLSYPGYAARLVKSGVNSFVVSMFSDEPAGHDALTSVKGSFEQAVLGVKNAKELGVFVMIHFVLLKQNFRQLPRMTGFFLDLGADYVRVMLCHPIGGSAKYFHKLVPKISDAAPYLKKALDLGLKRKKTVVLDNFPFCCLKGYEKLFTSFSQNFRKVVQYTPAAGVGSMYKDRMGETVKAPGCAGCRFDRVCDGLFRRYAAEYGTGELRPVRKAPGRAK